MITSFNKELPLAFWLRFRLRFHTKNILKSVKENGVGNGNPLQYSCLENSMDRGAWWGREESGTAEWLSTWRRNTKQKQCSFPCFPFLSPLFPFLLPLPFPLVHSFLASSFSFFLSFSPSFETVANLATWRVQRHNLILVGRKPHYIPEYLIKYHKLPLTRCPEFLRRDKCCLHHHLHSLTKVGVELRVGKQSVQATDAAGGNREDFRAA